MMFNKVYLGATPISKIFLGDVPIKYGNNIVAIYTVNDINKASPTLVVGKADDWKETVVDNGDNTYTVTITASRGPTKISFENNTSLLSVDYLNYRNITDMSDMFYNCTNLQTLHLDDWSYDSISMIINVSSLPINDIGTIKSIHCKKEEADGLIAPENWEFSYPYNTIAKYTVKDKQKTSPSYVAGKADDWEETVKDNGDGTYTVTITASYGPTYIDFDSYSGITLLTVDYLDISNITSMSYMFNDCHYLTSINVRNWNTSQVTDMSYMFKSCNRLTSLDLSKFDTSKVTDMNHMFQGCDNLTSLDLSNFDTSNVTNMEAMFNWCSLTSLDLSNFDTSKVTNMDHMFSWSNSLTSLDLSNFDMTNVTDMEAMFYNCNNLTSLDLSNWSTFSAYESYMFTNCNKLESLYLTNCNFSTVNRIINMKDFPKNKIDGVIRTIHWKNDNWKNEITLIPPPTNWMYSFMLHDLVAIYTVSDSRKTSPDLVEGKADDWGETVLDNGNGTYKVIVTASSRPTRIRFNNSSTNNTTLLYVDYIDTSNMTSMNNMFSKCTKLRSVNTSNFDTDQVTDMESMFSNCDSLTSLDLSSFDTNQVTNISYMFSGCDSLILLNVSNFDTSNVTNMRMMFASCTSLTSLNLSSFDTSNVKNMSDMFYNCKSLTTLNLSNFDTSNAINMAYMFDGCTSLQELCLDNCNNSNISEIITSIGFPTNHISGVTRIIYCRESEAAGLTPPGNWVFSSYVS